MKFSEKKELFKQCLKDAKREVLREDFVKRIIIEIIRGEIEKPEWLRYVEEEMSCSCCNAAPSTFLFLIPKDEKYRTLAARLLDFLYSPNMMTTELKY